MRLFAITLLASASFAAAARAQEVLLQQTGPSNRGEFGTSIAYGPDLDGDGFNEVAVGAPLGWQGTHVWGAAYILSGRDFSILQTIYGDEDRGGAGRAVCWCGDVDADGTSDLAIGEPDATGKVLIYSGQSGSKVRELVGASAGDEFGYALANAGDTNGDGIDDLLVGAPREITKGMRRDARGAIYLISGADGSTLLSMQGDPSSGLGGSVAAVGDVNGDGIVDFAGGAPTHAKYGHYYYDYYSHSYYYFAAYGDYAGAVQVFSGADGSLLYEWLGRVAPFASSYYPYVGDYLGESVGPAGDFDGDGTPDVFGSSQDDVVNGHAYTVVYSGATGAVLRIFLLPGDNQRMAAPIPDLNGDGLPEFMASRTASFSFPPSYPWSGVYLLSSIDGKILWETDDGNASDIAQTVAVAGSGPPRFLLGWPRAKNNGFEFGSAELRATDDLWLDVAPTHFPAAGDPMTLRANEGPTGNPAALILTGVNGTPTFNFLTIASFDATGSALFASAPVPSGFAGNTVTLRALAIGASGHLVSSIDETLTLR